MVYSLKLLCKDRKINRFQQLLGTKTAEIDVERPRFSSFSLDNLRKQYKNCRLVQIIAAKKKVKFGASQPKLDLI